MRRFPYVMSQLLRFSFLIMAACWQYCGSAAAQTWPVAQGDVLRIEIPVPEDIRSVRVSALEKDWPQRRSETTLIAWIGIDLITSPGLHPLDISAELDGGDSWQRKDEIEVIDVEFPESHIEVEKEMAEFDAETLARIRAEAARLRAAYSSHVDATPDIAFDRQPVVGILSSPFGARRIVNGEARSPHSGIDIAAIEGTPIFAPLSGRVLVAESMYLNGNAVAIGHGNGLVSVYTHMQTLEVEQGQWLDTGDRIGAIGMTGRSTGPHLHWGVRFNNARIDPGRLLPADTSMPHDFEEE